MPTSKFYITTPIYYVNDSPHIGHAYTTVACDVMARFKKLDGYDVKFLTGTDEHGQKVDKAAKAANIDPQEFTDDVSKRFRNLVNTGDNLLNITNDDFVRTTEERHKKAASELWSLIKQNNPDAIYKDKYAGWYSVRDEAYYQESELVDDKAPTGAEVEWVEEESYFFRLSAFQQKLLDFYEANPDFVIPQSRYNEVKSFVRGGKDFVEGALKDLSISRTTFDWGVAVPEDDKHVMYVWIDALTNYLTGTGFPDKDSDYQDFWVDAKNSPVHMVGKDILRFHAVYWPAFLMAANIPLPKKIVAHGWWTIEGEKMSKSLGNVVAPKDLVDQYGLDQVRYFLMREVPFGNDGNFCQSRLVDVVNSDLANNIGNLAQRTLSMIQKNCDGALPEVGELNDSTQNLIKRIREEFITNTAQFIDEFKYNEVIAYIIDNGRKFNEYIDAKAPWSLKKEGKTEEMCTVLYVLAEAIRCIAISLQPFTPGAASKILDQLNIKEDQRDFKHLCAEYAIKPGIKIPKPEGVFPRLEISDKKEAS